MIMRAEEESYDVEQIEAAATRLLDACADMDLTQITDVLREFVIGFAGHEPRHDFVWVKQGRVGKRVRKPIESDNVTPLPSRLVTARDS